MNPRRFFVPARAASLLVLVTTTAILGRVEARQPGAEDRAGGEADRAKADFYVATDGSDENPGTRAKPFATLARARDAVRQLKSGSRRKAGVTVLVRGGTYVLNEPLVFGPEDSGTPEHRMVYAAYPGEKPVLSGGHPIS